MANTFVNAGTALSTTNRTTLYTAPAATQSIIHALYLANTDGVNSVDVTVEATVDGGTTYIKVLNTVPIPADSSLVLDKPINLEAGDILAVTSSAANDIEVFSSILEIT